MKWTGNRRGLLCLLSPPRRIVPLAPLPTPPPWVQYQWVHAHATSLGAVSVGAVELSSVTSTQSEWLSLVLRVTEPLGEQSGAVERHRRHKGKNGTPGFHRRREEVAFLSSVDTHVPWAGVTQRNVLETKSHMFTFKRASPECGNPRVKSWVASPVVRTEAEEWWGLEPALLKGRWCRGCPRANREESAKSLFRCQHLDPLTG